MKFINKGILLYCMLMSLIGILLFGVLLLNLMMKDKFSKINSKKMQENEGIWLMLLLFLCSILGFTYSWKRLYLKSDLEIEEATEKIFSKILKKDKEKAKKKKKKKKKNEKILQNLI